MKIVLIRHAKVLIDNNTKLNYKELKKWIKNYNHAPIESSLPSIELQKILKESSYILTSTLLRGKASLQLLNIEPNEKNSLFDEIELTSFNMPLIKFKPKNWLIVLRILMFIKITPIIKAKKRAKKASLYLKELANKNITISLMGHGALNYLILKELQKYGWKIVVQSSGHGNWAYKVLECSK